MAAPGDPEEAKDDIVVVGVRAGLAIAQDVKKNADTFVDSITATDIGAFPDKSVAEALQRVPGITVGAPAVGRRQHASIGRGGRAC